MEADDLYYKVRADVTHAREQVFSVSIRVNQYCGGACPQYHFEPITFDLQSAKQLQLADLFAEFERRQSEILAVFASAIRSARRTALEEAGTDPSTDSCLQRELAQERLATPRQFTFVFVDDGLKIEAARASARCGAEAVIPYDRLRPFAAPGSALHRVAEG